MAYKALYHQASPFTFTSPELLLVYTTKCLDLLDNIHRRFIPRFQVEDIFNPIALRMAKILWSFGLSGCKRVK